MVMLPSRVYVRINVVLWRDRIEDEVKTASELSHLISISRNNYPVCAEAKRVFFFVRQSCNHYQAHGQTLPPYDLAAETYYPDLLTFGVAPMPHGRVCCNSRADEMRHSDSKERAGQSECIVTQLLQVYL